MLKTIDTIHWGSLTHAYGEASDTPLHIKNLLSPNPRKRKQAYRSLLVSVYHAEGGYSSSPVVVPFLIELLEAPDVHQKNALLILIYHLAISGKALWLENGVQEGSERFEKHFSDEYLVASYREAAKGIPVYIALLENNKATVRTNAAFLLAWFSSSAEQIVPALRKKLTTEKNKYSKASTVLALGILSQHDHENKKDIAYFQHVLTTVKGVVKHAAAIALTYACKKHIGYDVLSALKDTIIEDRYVTELIFPWSSLASHALEMLYLYQAVTGNTVVPLLTEVLVKSTQEDIGSHPEDIAIYLITCCFKKDSTIGENKNPKDLTETQRQVLTLFVQYSQVWRLKYGDINTVLKHYGLPDRLNELASFLGIIPKKQYVRLEQVIQDTALSKILPQAFVIENEFFQIHKAITRYYSFSSNLIKKLQAFLDWEILSQNTTITFTSEVLFEYKEKWVWWYICRNKTIIWNEALLEQFKDNIHWRALSGSIRCPESVIQKYEQYWDWDELSMNTSIPWTIELLKHYKNKWNWWNLSANPSLPWSYTLYDQFHKRFVLDRLCENNSLPWSQDYVNDHADNLTSVRRFMN